MKVYKELVNYKGEPHSIESWYEKLHRVWYAMLVDSSGNQVFESEFAMLRLVAVRYVKDQIASMEKVA